MTGTTPGPRRAEAARRSRALRIECRVRRIEEDLGDHALIVLEVVAAECRRDARPLLLADSPWEYGGEAVGDASRGDVRSR